MTRIVGVHGVGNFRPGETAEKAAQNLSNFWHRRISMNLPSISAEAVEVAYYADQLHTPGRQGADDLNNLSAEAEEMLRAWLETLDAPTGISQGWGTWPLRQTLGWLAERRHISPRLLELFVTRFFSEVATYLNPNSQARVKARDRVVEALRRHHPNVVIAHSLGSVVAYEALWACPEARLDALITLGSPLALPHAVFPRLQPVPQNDRGARPPGVARWVNLADPGDLVAVPRFGVSRRFSGVDLDEHSLVHTFDFHLVSHYLTSTRLISTLNEH
ncbi:serine peptidase [Kutzneria sp. CA-103260]|uniref:serine peptidase n=1 Tax=Kutzneria sp. CA-103260 TaxID=2802641 RepID=UPI001BA5874A|nr:serine peptidase [Kutzneria sp. CA-103260]QUQ64605.1 hypothetical protein JJ691_23250 [Kutzneria sp. CA-103260]